MATATPVLMVLLLTLVWSEGPGPLVPTEVLPRRWTEGLGARLSPSPSYIKSAISDVGIGHFGRPGGAEAKELGPPPKSAFDVIRFPWGGSGTLHWHDCCSENRRSKRHAMNSPLVIVAFDRSNGASLTRTLNSRTWPS